MRKLIATLFAAICLITAFGQVDSLKNASLIGQASRNQKVGQGFQIGFVGSSDDTCQINTKLQIVPNAGAGKVLTSDANGFATWAPIVFSNGITKTADSIKLGGTLIDNTSIHYDQQYVLFGSGTTILNSNSYVVIGNGQTLGTDTAILAAQVDKFLITTREQVLLSVADAVLSISSNSLGFGGEISRVDIDTNGKVTLLAMKMETDAGNGKVLTSDANGNATWQSSDQLFTVDSVAITGDTTTLAAGTYTAVIASGTITDLVLLFPASPANNDRVIVKFDYAVTTLSADGQGKTIYGFPTSTVLGQHREWRYNSTTGAWY